MIGFGLASSFGQLPSFFFLWSALPPLSPSCRIRVPHTCCGRSSRPGLTYWPPHPWVSSAWWVSDPRGPLGTRSGSLRPWQNGSSPSRGASHRGPRSGRQLGGQTGSPRCPLPGRSIPGGGQTRSRDGSCAGWRRGCHRCRSRSRLLIIMRKK